MDSEKLNSVQSESLHTLRSIIHTIGHKVVMLRNLLYLLEKDETVRSQRGRQSVERISQVVDDLDSDLRLMRLFASGIDFIYCDFLSDVLQPAVSLSYGKRHNFRLIVEPAVRETPHVHLRPAPVLQALMTLFLTTKPKEARCTAASNKDMVFFSMNLHPVSNPVTDDTQKEVRHLLDIGGVLLEESSHDKDVFAVKLKLTTV